jgi:LPS-assembly lipoprotein
MAKKLSFYLIIGLLLLHGCGFQLRGSTALTLTKVYLQSEGADRLTDEVKRVLTDEGVQITPTAKDAQVTVYLRQEAIDRRILSVSAVSGKMQEIELNYRVEMEARKPDNKVLLDKQLLSLSRDYTFDETAVLAMGDEEQVLREELFRDIIMQVVRRLQTIK